MNFTRVMRIIPPIFMLTACTIPPQKDNEVLVRCPGDSHYSKDKLQLENAALLHWEYAILSENAYQPDDKTIYEEQLNLCNMTEKQKNKAIKHNKDIVRGDKLNPKNWSWVEWNEFPINKIDAQKAPAVSWCKAQKLGLHYEVHQKTILKEGVSFSTIAVVFRGTEASDFNDWRANFRWVTRIIPGEDEYSLTKNEIVKDVYSEVVRRINNGILSKDNLTIVSTGHSLGGGIAQQFAYALHPEGKENPEIRVSEVYAFDPSPVTGWGSVPSKVRDFNAEGLKDHRIFEHGEVLAYLRLFLSYLSAPTVKDPAISETRYDVLKGYHIISNHSIRNFAIELSSVAGYETSGDSKLAQVCEKTLGSISEK